MIIIIIVVSDFCIFDEKTTDSKGNNQKWYGIYAEPFISHTMNFNYANF